MDSKETKSSETDQFKVRNRLIEVPYRSKRAKKGQDYSKLKVNR